MKHVTLYTILTSLALLTLVIGCTTNEEPPVNEDTSGLGDTESESESDVPEDSRCRSLDDVELDHQCGSNLLGAGVRLGMCLDIYSCEGDVTDLFEDIEACEAACDTKKEFCNASDGDWVMVSRGGDYVCGQPPVCSTPACNDPYLPGCNCGQNKSWDDTLGCVDDASCVAPNCDDHVDVDFTFGSTCIADLGWMVRDGSCQLVKGCADLTYGFFATRENCNATCNTPQRICMESGGAWLGTDAFDGLTKSTTYYDCGEKLAMIDPPLAPCNCGPSANYVNGVGCQADAACPGLPECPTYDFGIDYPSDPRTTAQVDCDWDPPNPPGYIPMGRGLVNGDCSTFFACSLDFTGTTAWVDPTQWFTEDGVCEIACDPDRCESDDDCVDTDTSDEDGVYCHFDADSNCGAFTRGGLCETRGGVCSLVFDPLCGCNGNLSAIGCVQATGNPVLHDGECFEFPPLD